jgi:hypothetical protein
MSRAGRLAFAALFCFASIAAIVIVARDVAVRAMDMQPSRTTNADFTAAKPGDAVSVIVRIVKADPGGAISARLLAPITQTRYRLTRTAVEALVGPETRYVMGTAGDLKPGIVAQFDGVMAADGALTLRRAVVLTPYVEVADP